MISSLRQPVEVLVDNLSGGLDKMALDVKTINALGQSHFSESLVGSLEAADAYRTQAMEFQDTAARCAQRGVRFEPMVFTCPCGWIVKGSKTLVKKAKLAGMCCDECPTKTHQLVTMATAPSPPALKQVQQSQQPIHCAPAGGPAAAPSRNAKWAARDTRHVAFEATGTMDQDSSTDGFR